MCAIDDQRLRGLIKYSWLEMAIFMAVAKSMLIYVQLVRAMASIESLDCAS